MSENKTETAYFSAGCFWGIQEAFDNTSGVLETEVGYAGGHMENPSYENVCGGKTGHAETVKVVFDPEKISFEDLALRFFKLHDPTQLNRQGPDIGEQYRSAIFFTDDEQKKVAESLKDELDSAHEFGKPIATEITPFTNFYKAEEYHQKYIQKTGRHVC